jgi:hypothetical protein
MQNRTLEKLKTKNPLLRELEKCLVGSTANIVEAGKIVLKLRETLPNCDQVLLEMFPQHLTPHKLERLCLCGKNELIPDFVTVHGTLGKKLLALPIDLQTKVYTEGVEVVIGGTASKPATKRYTWHELQPGHAAQVFDGERIRSQKEQIAYRVRKVKSVLPPYAPTTEGLRVNRGCLIPWMTLNQLLKNNLAPLTGAA